MQTNIKEGIRALVRADVTLSAQERNAIYATIDNPLGVRRPAEEVTGRVVKYPEAARLLSLSSARVYQLVRDGALVAVYGRPKAEGGRAIGVTLASIKALMGRTRTPKESQVEAATAAVAEA